MKIFWTDDAFEAEVRRRVFVVRQQTGAIFDPERIPLDALRVAIAAYHGVGIEAVKEDSYFLKPMRAALREFGRQVMKDAPVSIPEPWDYDRTLYSLRRARNAP